jgi:hypothetical protein
VRLTTKLSILALVFATALAFQPIASATTLDLVYNGSVVGTATLTQSGSNVDVSISMKSGFAIVGNGGDIGVKGSVSNKTTINDFSVAGMSADLKKNGTIGSFTFTDLFKLSMGHGNGQSFSTNLSFTINNASSISALGLHICIKFANGTCASGNNTVFVETSQPPTVPEPGTLGLLGTGLVGLAGVVRRHLIS